MFNTLFTLFKSTMAIGHMADLSQWIAHIVNLFEMEFAEDKDAKNAAIDSVIAILQAHKDKIQ